VLGGKVFINMRGKASDEFLEKEKKSRKNSHMRWING
jgi:hypothetical protein